MSRIENLGSYNDVRILLQKYGGDKEKLFQAIGDATALVNKFWTRNSKNYSIIL